MPSGYTAAIYEGKDITFEEFALDCARAFGATIMQRDDPKDAPLRLPTEAPYYREKIEEARKRLRRLQGMTTDQAASKAAEDYETDKARFDETVAERDALEGRYHAMLAKVQAWVPPTPEHSGLKEFMVEQLRDSIRFDCSTTHLTPPKRLTAHEWLEKEIAQAQRDIGYYEREWAKEVERTNGRRGWIMALAESLDVPVDEEAGVVVRP